MIINHDPNEARNINPKHVEITLMAWQYKATYNVVVTGNVSGFDLFNAAISALEEQLYNEDEDKIIFTLTDPKGDTLICEDEENEGEDFIKNHVVQLTTKKFGE